MKTSINTVIRKVLFRIVPPYLTKLRIEVINKCIFFIRKCNNLQFERETFSSGECRVGFEHLKGDVPTEISREYTI